MLPRSARVMRAAAAALACAAVAACSVATPDIAAHRARTALVGLAAHDLRLCAGIPNRTVAGEDGVQVWEYERTTAGSGLTVNTLWADVNLSRIGECRAVFEISGGAVRRLAFARVSGRSATPLSACVPLVQECVDMVANGSIAPVASPADAGPPPAGAAVPAP